MPIRIIQQGPKPVGQAEDVGRSALQGVTEGFASIPGLIGDARGMAETAAGKFADFIGAKGEHPKMRPSFPMEVMSNVARDVGAKVGVDPRMARLAFALTAPGGLMTMPNSAELTDAALSPAVTGMSPYKPQTKAGEYTRTVAQFAPAVLAPARAATLPGQVAGRLAQAVVPGVASQAAADLPGVKGTKMEPAARLAAAVLSTGGLAALTRGGPDTRILAEAARGATDDQVAQAANLMRDAETRGVQLTMAEALQQVTNGGTGMGRVQRVIEGTRAGSDRIAPVMAERPGQVRQAVTDYADTLAPATDNPSMVGARAQTAADGALTGVRRFINSVAEPRYDALVGQEIPAAEYAALAGDPSYTAGLQALRNHPELGATVANLPDNNLAVVNEVLKRVGTMADQARPGPMNPAGDNGLAALRDRAAGSAAEIAANASPDFAAARQGVAAGRQQFLEPLQRGPLGQIANNPDVKAQTSALFPAQPMEGAPAETARALELLAGQNPQAPAELTRQHLVNALNEATQDNLGGPNQWGGAKFAAQVAGNPEQARTLGAGIDAAGGNRGEMDRLIEVLRATGRRERPGSMTAYNARDLEELGQAGALGEGVKAVASGPATFRRIGEALQNWQTERNAGRLADAIVANPDQAEQILMRARQVVPPGEGLQTIERAALAAQLSRRPELEGR